MPAGMNTRGFERKTDVILTFTLKTQSWELLGWTGQPFPLVGSWAMSRKSLISIDQKLPEKE